MQTRLKDEQEFSRLILKNPLLAEIIAAEPDYLLPRLQFDDLPFNQTIYDEGDQIGFVYFPIDSLISSLAILEDGTTVEVSMIGRDAMTGTSVVLGTGTNQYWTRMCVGGTVAKLDSEALSNVFSNNERIMKTILQNCASLVTQISQRSVCNVRHSVMERFCCWLLMVQDRIGSQNLQLTQELIASRLGARRAGITVAACELHERNAIEYKRGSLHIKDRSIVQQQTCECYSVLKAHVELLRWNESRQIEPTGSRRANSPLNPDAPSSYRKGQPIFGH
jgi:CRP-like cAMP-binding protein